MTFKFRPGDRVSTDDRTSSVVLKMREIDSSPHYALTFDSHTWFPERLLRPSPTLREIYFFRVVKVSTTLKNSNHAPTKLMHPTPLLDRCYKCREISPIAKVEPVTLYGKPVDRVYCAPCSGIKRSPESDSQTKAGSLNAKQLKTSETHRVLVLQAIGSGVCTRDEINASIAEQAREIISPHALSQVLRNLVRAGQLEEGDRVGKGKSYRVRQKEVTS